MKPTLSLVQRKLISQHVRRISLELLLIPLAYLLALLVHFDGDISPAQLLSFTRLMALIAAVHIGVNVLLGLYRRLWAFASLADAWLVLAAASLATAVLLLLNLLTHLFAPFGGGALIVGGLLTALFSTAVKYRRFFLRQFTSVWLLPRTRPRERALIVGANALARQLAQAPVQLTTGLDIVGFVDKHDDNQGMSINGLAIVGTPEQIPALVREHKIDVLILAEEDARQDDLWQLITRCQQTPAQIKVLPDVNELMNPDYHSPLTLRDLKVEDVLARQPLAFDHGSCRHILQDRVVLVTGAAGSIGSELCRQLSQFKLRTLLALDNNETGLFDLDLALARQRQAPLRLLLADIADADKMEQLFTDYRPHVVFHAAAFKHVPLMELNPDQSLRVNVAGTMEVSRAAHRHGAERFVLISSDKAVNPSSVMGASKYLCELWLRALNDESDTMFTAVRFGNVIGSRGSVLPVFKQQIEAGGPVTVTHKEMKRFFMSIPEAVNLVLQAAALGGGGEIFMLDMGEEVSIQELAERMIRLRGLRVHKDIPIEYIGIRPGEKLREELSYQNETHVNTRHPRIFTLQTRKLPPTLDDLEHALAWLIAHRYLPHAQLRHTIFQLAYHDEPGFWALAQQISTSAGQQISTSAGQQVSTSAGQQVSNQQPALG